MKLTPIQLDRARAMISGAAIGDALGAGYEFAKPKDPDFVPGMIGGGLGPFAPGEWTDDTAQTYVVLSVAASYKQLLDTAEGLNAVALGLKTWALSKPPDIGVTTSRVLNFAPPLAHKMQERAVEVMGQSNGSLMRTSPVVLPFLDDGNELGHAAMSVSSLTHAGEDAMEACAVWCAILREAVLTGEFVPQPSLDFLSEASEKYWRRLIGGVLDTPPPSASYSSNGSATGAFSAALAAVAHTEGHDFVGSLNTAIRFGYDTDTVASIAGALVGALNGSQSIPLEWMDMVHGYPGINLNDLDNLVLEAVR